MELKTTSTLKKKNKLVRKLKARFGEGTTKDEEDDEHEEEEAKQCQGPLSLTQGMGEDVEEEGAEEEQAKEAPRKPKPKKRKEKKQPTSHPKGKKVVKSSLAKPTIPVTRATTRATTQKAKEQVKEKKKATKQ